MDARSRCRWIPVKPVWTTQTSRGQTASLGPSFRPIRLPQGTTRSLCHASGSSGKSGSTPRRSRPLRLVPAEPLSAKPPVQSPAVHAVVHSLRRAVPEDAPAITELVQAAYAGYVERIGLRPAPMDVDYVDEIATREIWVLPGVGRLDAVLVVHAEADHLFVHNIAVLAERQGEGLGRALLEFAERRAAELGLPELRLLTNELMTENRAMYEHLGWEEIEQRAEHGYSRVYVRKRLAS